MSVAAAGALAMACSEPDVPPTAHLELALAAARYSNPELPDVLPSVAPVQRGIAVRPAITTYAPSKLQFDVQVPPAGRLDLAMTIEPDGAPLTFVVAIEGAEREVLFEGPLDQGRDWVSRSVDLARFAGERVVLSLEAESSVSGTAAYWGAPIVKSDAPTTRPNVILYIIDAAGADFMSVYGHERRTTPFMEELAARGTLFERAYSNSTWTKISTPSFLSSLHTSALGGYLSREDVIPAGVETLPQLLRRSGYTTAEITSNPFAGMMTGLDRGLDFMRDSGVARNAVSSVELHANLLQWRQVERMRPYWVHVQTTDVHWPWDPEPPYLGTFTSAAERDWFYASEARLATAVGLPRPQWLHAWRYPEAAFETVGIDRLEFFAVADRLYDESMLHNDAQLRDLIDRLTALGDWDNTILIIASDHSSAHGLGSQPEIPDRDGPIMNSMRTRIPLLVVWPGHVQAGQRVTEPVSMIDILPTVLDLAGLPPAAVAQGHSFAPVLLGQPWEARPVTLDEMNIQEDGLVAGWLEVIDGRWGASWRFEGRSSADRVAGAEVRLCDLPTDPLCTTDVAAQQADVVARLVPLLQERWEAAWLLAAQYDRSERTEMSEEQRRTLRALGYIQ
jgi:arylsulfatase A-like enzyme